MIEKKSTKPRTRDDVPWPPDDLGSRLHHLRMDTANNRANEQSQQAVCDSLSSMLDHTVSYKKYSKWENKTMEPSLKELTCLAIVFNTTCDYLLTGIQADHVTASRKCGLSEEALRALENMNYSVKTASDSEISSHIKHYIHPLGYINALLAAPAIKTIAFDFTMHTLHVFQFKDRVEKIKELNERHNTEWSQSERFSRYDGYLNKAKSISEAQGYKVVDPEIILKMEEYELSKQWSKLFRSLLKNEDILMKGVTSFVDKRLLDDEEFDSITLQDGPLNEEQYLHLRKLFSNSKVIDYLQGTKLYPNNSEEAQHEEGK